MKVSLFIHNYAMPSLQHRFSSNQTMRLFIVNPSLKWLKINTVILELSAIFTVSGN